MNKHFIFILALGLDCLILSINAQESKKKLTSYVNPFIGTGSKDIYSPSGNTFPGATTPFGLVQLSPDTKDAPYNPSGYDYSHNEIAGFSHTHLSGTGCPDLYDVLVMPGIGDFHKIENGQKLIGYISRFDHAEETARPGYYQVKLLDYNINAELTVTEHVGLHQYTFPESNNANIIIDLAHRISKEISWIGCNILTSQIRIINNKTIEGFRILTGWTDGPRKVYFRAEFSKPFNSSVLWNNGTELENQNILNGRELKAVLNFSTVESEKISIKVALSTVSCDNAQLNMQKELPAWNFENVCKSADSLWENELQKIRVDGTKEQMEIFYTSMYHAFVQPNNLADVNGEYTGTDMVTRNAPDRKHYSTFSLWDIYRAAHPLYSLIQPARNAEFVNSMIRQYETMGFLPIWQLWGQENYCMIGNHAIPIIVDAILNGLPGIDSEEAYKAVLNSSLNSHENSPFKIWEKYGYIPEDILSQSVSITEEMAFNDWCVAQLAKKLGKNEDYQRFMKRAEFFKNLFDTSTHFFRAKNTDGKWIEPFVPEKYSANGNGPYTEGNAWHYLFYAPQDMNGLINLYDGKEKFAERLDSFFNNTDKPKEAYNYSTGFIGQYSHGNEPGHHVGYLYNYAGKPWKPQKVVNQILTEFYSKTVPGLAGNEDCGQMSAWYIFGAMGFYPVNPASGVYVFGSPILKSIEINLDNGNKFTISTKNWGKDNIYIQSVKINDKPYTKTFITHKDIVAGGNLEFEMGSKPNKKWGVNSEDCPPVSAYLLD